MPLWNVLGHQRRVFQQHLKVLERSFGPPPSIRLQRFRPPEVRHVFGTLGSRCTIYSTVTAKTKTRAMVVVAWLLAVLTVLNYLAYPGAVSHTKLAFNLFCAGFVLYLARKRLSP